MKESEQKLKQAGEERVDAEKRDLRDLAEDIITAHDTRVKVVGEIIEDTHQMMANFKTKREQMAQGLQQLLAKSESLRKKDFARMMAGIIDAHAKREQEVGEMLEHFRKEEEMVAGKLRGLLAKGEEVRMRDFKKMMQDLKQWQERKMEGTSASVTDQLRSMQEEVHTMLDNFKMERQSVAGAWHEMLNLFHEAPRVHTDDISPNRNRGAESPEALPRLPEVFNEGGAKENNDRAPKSSPVVNLNVKKQYAAK